MSAISVSVANTTGGNINTPFGLEPEPESTTNSTVQFVLTTTNIAALIAMFPGLAGVISSTAPMTAQQLATASGNNVVLLSQAIALAAIAA